MTIDTFYFGYGYWRGGSGDLGSDFLIGYTYNDVQPNVIVSLLYGPTPVVHAHFGPADPSGIAVGSPNGGILSGSLVVSSLDFSPGGFNYDLVGSIQDESGFNIGETSGYIEEFSLESGAYFSSGVLTVGSQRNGVGVVNIKGPGATWSIVGQLNVAYAGVGTVTVAQAGTLLSQGPYNGIGGNNGNSGSGTLIVDGVGSLWQSGGQIGVGLNGEGTLTVSNSGSVGAVDEINVAENVGATGKLTIESGGSVTSGGTYDTIGGVADADGTVSVTGLGSSWILTASLVIGNDGTGELDISNQGSVNAGQLTVGQDSGAVGTVSVTGGGTLTTAGPYDALGNGTGSSGTVTVSGTGSVWDSADQITVADNGDATLNVNGGTVTSAGVLTVGSDTGAKGTLDINSGTVIATGGLTVGSDTGAVGTLDVEAGGTFTSDGSYTFAGANVGSDGTIIVSGTGALLSGSAAFIIGNSGTGVATVSNGGVVDVNSVAVGQLDQSDGSLTIESGGTVTNSGITTVGNTAGSEGNLAILAGGTLESTAAAQTTYNYLRIGLNGPSGGLAAAQGTVEVDGAGALLDAGANPLVIGGSTGGDGTLTVQDGGTVIAASANSSDLASLNFANYQNATATVTVTGEGSELIGNGYVLVGRGGTAALTIENDATMQVNDATLNGGGMGIGAGRSSGPNNSNNFGGTGSASVTSGGLLDINSTISGITVGCNGVTGTLSVNDGGVVMTGFGMTVGTATKVGGTIYGGSGTLNIGANGTVEITNPTRATGYGFIIGNANTDVGGSTDAARGTVVVSGVGALLDTNGDALAVGYLSNGTLDVGSGGTVNTGSVTVGDTGIINLSGGTIDSTGITLGAGGEIIGSGTISSDIINDGTIIVSGGTLVIDGSIAGNGTVIVDNNGDLVLNGVDSSDEVYDFAGTTGTIVIDDTSFDGTIENFGTDDVIDDNPSADSSVISPAPSDLNRGLAGTTPSSFALASPIGSSSLGTLTLGYGYQNNLQTVKNTATFFAGSSVVAQFNFGTTAVIDLEPVKDGSGGTKIIQDLGTTSAADPGGTKIDWGFIHKWEGGVWYSPYVIPNTTGGVTVGAGADLGTGPDSDPTEFAALFPQWAMNPNLGVVYGFLEDTGVDATNTITSAGLTGIVPPGDRALLSVSLDMNQVNTLTTDSEALTLSNLNSTWLASSLWGSSPKLPITDLPAQAQTVLFDIAYQYGASNLPLHNKHGTPKFWSDMIAAAKTVSNANPYGDPAAWSTVIDELQDFGDAFGPRRLAEAALIRQIPILIVAPPPPVSIPGVPTTPTMIAYNFSITDSSTQYALDPSGEDTYTLTENSGSPNISSIELPAESAPSYSVSYEIGATWSAPEIAQPLQTLTLPNGVSGLQVTLLDDNGVPETTASDFTFYVTFSGAGTFSGDVTTPETACFLPGTHIATPTGEVRVERLAVGDMVRTATGARRLEWIGTGCVMVTRGRRSAATPIIVRKGALADNVPHQDLHITKGHSLFFDGVLIPAEFLVNHRSIVWDDFAREVTVYHLELDAHDILLANGAPAESYRDDGNRWLFRNANSGWGLPPQEPCAGNLRIRVKGCHKGILKGRGFGKSGAGISSISRPYFPKRRMFLRM